MDYKTLLEKSPCKSETSGRVMWLFLLLNGTLRNQRDSSFLCKVAKEVAFTPKRQGEESYWQDPLF